MSIPGQARGLNDSHTHLAIEFLWELDSEHVDGECVLQRRWWKLASGLELQLQVRSRELKTLDLLGDNRLAYLSRLNTTRIEVTININTEGHCKTNDFNTYAMATLGPAVSSLSSSLRLLQSSISVLDEGVSDFPRLCRVLSTQQHFELLPEPQLRDAQQSLVDEIAPAINQLLSTAENYVNQLGRKEESLKARYELLEGRLGRSKRGNSFGGIEKDEARGSGSALSEERMREMKRLQQKKERLQYAIDRLELQSKQRERELRKSMAVVRD